ncbi:MAG TPA: ABC transporter permease [Puia sp.]|nr:ABC transporter permease [Puia sp.]
MFKNYFKVAFRGLLKDKLHSTINIVGLSIGMAVALLIGLWIHDELSYDKNFAHYDRIARVFQNLTNNGEVQTWLEMPYPLADELRKHYGGDFKRVVMATEEDKHLLRLDDKKINVDGIFMEPAGTELFSLDMLRGDRHGLDDPTGVLLSESTARAYFGDSDPMNKIMKIDNLPPVKVTGVYRDFPKNCSFADLGFISSWACLYNGTEWIRTIQDPWRPNWVVDYVELNDHADIAHASARIRDAKLKMVNNALKTKKPALFLAPMSRWHLYSKFKNGVNVGGAIRYVWMFGIIGVFVLLLACINFMNLSTARSERRAREVGVRKTVGSSRRQLVVQFFTESFLTVIVAFGLALLLAWLALPFFNEVANKQLRVPMGSVFMWMSCLGFVLFTALVAGSYPAIYLSSFRPVKVLKGTFRAGRFAALPRRVLVVVQFTVSVALIIGTMVVYRQIQFAKDRPVGYSRKGLIAIQTEISAFHPHIDAIREELLKTGMVTDVAESSSSTTAVGNSSSSFDWPGKDPNFSIDFACEAVSWDYGKTIGWQIKEGRDFSREFLSDSSAIILNEAAAHMMDLKHPIGTVVSSFGRPTHVVGVVGDMVVGSPYDEAGPIIYLSQGNNSVNHLIVRINPLVTARDALAKIAPICKRFDPEEIFSYQFADDEYARKFEDEERIGHLAGFFALFAVVISCLGLFGLTSFVAEQRKKEIGVRKVLGASIFNVWNLLSRDFMRLVMISYLIAMPVGYLVMHSWLQGYQYRTGLSWWIFLAAGAGALGIAVIVVSFQAVRAGMMNVVKALRTE